MGRQALSAWSKEAPPEHAPISRSEKANILLPFEQIECQTLSENAVPAGQRFRVPYHGAYGHVLHNDYTDDRNLSTRNKHKTPPEILMAVKVTIRYPDPSDAVTSEALDTLRGFEAALCDAMVKVMCSTSNYHWKHASEHKSDVYFSLIKNADDEEVITIGMRELLKLTPEELLERIHLDQVFPERQRSKPSE